jgi:predicted Na+-dependent transporter
LKATIGAEVRFDFSAMVLSLAATVLAPVLAGLLLRAALSRVAGYRPGQSALSGARFAAQSCIWLFVVVGFGRAAPRLAAEPALAARFLLVAAILHGALIALTWALSTLAGLDSPSRTAVVLSGSQKTLPNGIFTAEKFFPSNPYASLPTVIYHVLQLVADTCLVALLAKRRYRSPPFSS